MTNLNIYRTKIFSSVCLMHISGVCMRRVLSSLICFIFIFGSKKCSHEPQKILYKVGMDGRESESSEDKVSI